MTSTLTTALAPPDHALSPGYPGLFVHSGVKHAPFVASLCATEGTGAVLGGRGVTNAKIFPALMDSHRQAGGNSGHVLFDAEAYTGKHRSRGAADMNPAWVRRQLNAGCAWALTDSGYIGQDDTDALDDVLTFGRSIGGRSITALPMHAAWLQGSTSRLVDKINAAGQPVAVMLEHASDPFAVRGTVRGFIRLLAQAEVPVLLLRSDLSALAAVAWGASAGAVGTTTTRRHIWPSKDSGGFRPPSVAALVPTLLAYVRLSKINDAILQGPDAMWSCRCSACYGRSLDWIATGEEAFQHSLAAIADLAHQVFDPRLDPAQRRQAWISRCKDAQVRAFEATDLARTEWRAPDFLGSWVAMASEVMTP